jgi:hypothetical protein
LPDPVCPYASTVALYPLKRPSTRGRTVRVYSSLRGWPPADSPKTWSKEKAWTGGAAEDEEEDGSGGSAELLLPLVVVPDR